VHMLLNDLCTCLRLHVELYPWKKMFCLAFIIWSNAVCSDSPKKGKESRCDVCRVFMMKSTYEL
jgi:hypothetical protein